jgi:ABC-type dipeptide/oligopeptide/nickel transport system permease component
VLRYVARRALGSLPVLVLVTFLVFSLVHLAPGDPITILLAENSTQADIDRARERWGLNDPVPVQYARFLGNVLMGDLGRSFRYGEPVLRLIGDRLPATLELAAFSVLIAVAIAIPIGVAAGWRPNSTYDNVGSLLGLFGVSMPNFWFGIMLILIFAGALHLLPSAGRSEFGVAGQRITGFYILDSLMTGNLAGVGDALRFIVLPAITLGTGLAGILMRITRSSVLEVSREDYVTTARAKGAPQRQVLWLHTVRNAMIPIVTVVGLELGGLLSGSIIAETVFAWPGIGSLLIEGVYARDYPLVTGIVLMYTVGFMLINLAVDVMYGVFDPRIRYP